MIQPVFEKLPNSGTVAEASALAKASDFYHHIRTRRTVRDFAPTSVPRQVIEHALLAAGTAPSGANLQPWHFTVIEDTDLRRRLREAAEIEERAFYAGRAPQAWLDALAPLGTDADKPFLEIAPVLIAIFAKRATYTAGGEAVKTYYVSESVGIATGFLIAALHCAGLATLTHTPSPMNFLNELCGRPTTEKPFLLLVAGYPAPGCMVPVHGGIKKALADIADWR
jgi:nitroreductase